MKTRDSGMPEEGYWSTFFDAEATLTALGLDVATGLVVDVGCGYGTFTLPVARLTGQRVVGIDIEADLVQHLDAKARSLGLTVSDTRRCCLWWCCRRATGRRLRWLRRWWTV